MILFPVAVFAILLVLCVCKLIATEPPQQRRVSVPPPAPSKTAPQPQFAAVLYEYRVTK